MVFEFNNQLLPQNLIDIEEIGEFAIEAVNDEAYSYFLIVRTILGVTTIATCGPCIPDVKLLPSGFKMTLDKMPYKEDKLSKVINLFLNDKNKKITKAEIISIDTAINEFRDLREYLTNYSEELN